jgi:hypothetical protein
MPDKVDVIYHDDKTTPRKTVRNTPTVSIKETESKVHLFRGNVVL